MVHDINLRSLVIKIGTDGFHHYLTTAFIRSWRIDNGAKGQCAFCLVSVFLPFGLVPFLVISITQKKKNRKKIKRQVGFMVLYIINNKPQCHAHKHNKYAHSIYTCCVLHSQISGGNVLAYPNR